MPEITNESDYHDALAVQEEVRDLQELFRIVKSNLEHRRNGEPCGLVRDCLTEGIDHCISAADSIGSLASDLHHAIERAEQRRDAGRRNPMNYEAAE